MFDLSVSPGKESQITVAITNTQNNAKVIRIEIADVTYTPENLPQFTRTATAPDSLRLWIEAEKNTQTIKPGAVVSVPLRILVPTNAAPGGHYGAILVSEEGNVTAGNPADISVVPKVAALLYLDVAGNVKREFTVTSFTAMKRFSGSFPITFSLSLKNTGTVHLQPHGVVTMTHAWTNAMLGTLIVNEDSAYLLPRKERTFPLVWRVANGHLFDPRLWGPYRAEVQLAATGAPRKTAAIHFWFIPIGHMLVEIGGVLCLLILVVIGVRRTFGYGKKK